MHLQRETEGAGGRVRPFSSEEMKTILGRFLEGWELHATRATGVSGSSDPDESNSELSWVPGWRLQQLQKKEKLKVLWGYPPEKNNQTPEQTNQTWA